MVPQPSRVCRCRLMGAGLRIDNLEPLGRPKGCEGTSLVLQGGGALGAYRAGVYQALHDPHDIHRP
jgi:predicted acylesterase/phospholipase RssA